MYELLASLFNDFFGSPCYNICILGPDQIGKTALFHSIKHIDIPLSQGQAKPYKPTVGLNVTRYRSGDDKLKVWDLGGRANLRKIWQNYYSECHGVIFLIDERLQQCFQILRTVLSHQQMASIPVVLIVTVPQVKQAVDMQIKQSFWMEDRKYVIHELPLSTCLFSNFYRPIIQNFLHWLYCSIRQLHESLRE